MNHSSDSETSDHKHPYPLSEDTATLGLHSLLIEEIKNLGPMPFDKWMQHCLYHPEFGYYTKGSQNVGRTGDFFTSVSVGSCFGSILAERIVKYISNHPPAAIVEIGANTGQLALDILNHLKEHHPTHYNNITYTICEPLERMREVQRNTLAVHCDKFTHATSLAKLTTSQTSGVILSNELIDAFPVKLVVRNNNQWLERCVDFKNETFQWSEQEIQSPKLKEFAQSLPHLPDGYLTEYRPGLESFSQLAAQMFETSLSITIDYGYPKSEYYHPTRNTGTLRCYHQHKADDEPLLLMGQKDITAHVDFSHLAKCMLEAQLAPQYFDSQTRYLIEHATPLLEKIEAGDMANSAKWIRQFHTLTHPSMMGNQFKVLECEKGVAASKEALTALELQ